jgi:flagellar biosynthesis/type III secretory pathway chaperone
MTLSRSLLASLETLEEQQLKKLLKRELGPKQIKSLLRRRDLILEKLEKDRAEYGDAFAFREEDRVP